ncbi:CDP-diacylglycerol--serine O-phosphatidyltransferase [Candidatus Magnetomonas plexicatena]|uniref:CDP-diacylglycerol--serine O-phosphatidyltransferase n=1 Tax=Candidatus Magnetomonas plexicatena TaxID=2552947 RepID=UPI001C76D6EA|nr:CDP-diacylglycerol--serine O-phosphatidyltransferase [Nitrospirales bacterium LBB_01]
MKRGVYILPNGLTLVGMFFGFYSIVSSLNGNFVTAGWAILIANIFDGLDGWTARMTNSTSRFGIELDSLSDLVAFGVAPAIMIFTCSLSPFGRIGWAVSFLYVSCGALRLARYNVQMVTAESKHFTGMPIPAAATILSTFVIFYEHMFNDHPHKSYFVLALTIVISLFMISTLRFHGAKEINFKERKPFLFLVAMIITLTVVVMHPPIMLFVLAISYLAWGIIENTYLLYRKKPDKGKTTETTV